MRIPSLLLSATLLAFAIQSPPPASSPPLSGKWIAAQADASARIELITDASTDRVENWYEDLFGHEHGSAVEVTHTMRDESIVVSIQGVEHYSGLQAHLRFTRQASGAPTVEAKVAWYKDVHVQGKPSRGWLDDLRGDICLDAKAFSESRIRAEFRLRGTSPMYAEHSIYVVTGAFDLPLAKQR